MTVVHYELVDSIKLKQHYCVGYHLLSHRRAVQYWKAHIGRLSCVYMSYSHLCILDMVVAPAVWLWCMITHRWMSNSQIQRSVCPLDSKSTTRTDRPILWTGTLDTLHSKTQ